MLMNKALRGILEGRRFSAEDYKRHKRLLRRDLRAW